MSAIVPQPFLRHYGPPGRVYPLVSLLAIHLPVAVSDGNSPEDAADFARDHAAWLRRQRRRSHRRAGTCWPSRTASPTCMPTCNATSPTWTAPAPWPTTAARPWSGGTDASSGAPARLWAIPTASREIDPDRRWAGLGAAVRVVAERTVHHRTTRAVRHCITNLPVDTGAARIADLVCDHWAVENSLHWVLDDTPGRTTAACAPAMPPATWQPCGASP